MMPAKVPIAISTPLSVFDTPFSLKKTGSTMYIVLVVTCIETMAAMTM